MSATLNAFLKNENSSSVINPNSASRPSSERRHDRADNYRQRIDKSGGEPGWVFSFSGESHRDVKALASTINLIGHVQWGRSDHPFKGGSFEYITDPELSASRFNSAIDRLDAGEVPPRQFHNMLYQDLVENTMAEIEKMYDHFGIRLSERGRDAMAKYLADNPREARPPHKFSMGSDAALARARKVYKRYQNHFGIKPE